MSDDSFIREVDEELRQDKAHALWKRYGPLAIGAAVALVLATGAWSYYTYSRAQKAGASGDRFLAALELIRDKKNDEAREVLKALEADGYGAYPVLARIRSATLLAESGDAKGAIAAFDAVAADASVDISLRDVAKLRAGLLLVDHGTYEEVDQRVSTLATDTNPLRHSAREALGLAAWKAAQFDQAGKLFDRIVQDTSTPPNLALRARTMLELMRGAGEYAGAAQSDAEAAPAETSATTGSGG